MLSDPQSYFHDAPLQPSFTSEGTQALKHQRSSTIIAGSAAIAETVEVAAIAAKEAVANAAAPITPPSTIAPAVTAFAALTVFLFSSLLVTENFSNSSTLVSDRERNSS